MRVPRFSPKTPSSLRADRLFDLRVVLKRQNQYTRFAPGCQIQCARAAHRIFSMSGRKPAPMRLGMNPRGGAPPILAKASDLTALYAFAVQPDTLSLWENAPLIVQI